MARRRRPGRPGGPRGKKKRRKPPQPRSFEPKVPDTPSAVLEEQTRLDVKRLMKSRQRDLGLTEDERLLDRVISDHPEHAELFAAADDWVVTGADESPYLHVAYHRLVEQRIVSRELTNLNTALEWHEAVHEAIELVAEEFVGDRDPQAAHAGGDDA